MPEPVVARVFCLPYAGGSSLAYRGWSDLGPGLEVVAVDYPGRLMRPAEPLLDSVPALVAALTEELSPSWDLPFVLCGTSLGSLVAFELARAAEQAGRPPEAVVLCACAAPGRPPRNPPVTDLTDTGFLDAVADRYGGALAALSGDPEAQAVVLPMLRADLRAFERYTAQPVQHPPIAADVVAFSGQQDHSTGFGEIAGWRAFTTGDFQIRSVPGGHFFIEQRPPEVIGEIRARLRDHRTVETS
ncbi:thioesterase II family protein [Streptomyces sp. NPDC002018]|uniref:thioesterase II family protein n=1 Tax=Streptomyces sp. NPDC002018 TaxID=3364629 RepID=UPI0036C7017F